MKAVEQWIRRASEKLHDSVWLSALFFGLAFAVILIAYVSGQGESVSFVYNAF